LQSFFEKSKAIRGARRARPQKMYKIRNSQKNEFQ